jgi:hypothetical protein
MDGESLFVEALEEEGGAFREEAGEEPFEDLGEVSFRFSTWETDDF